MCSSSCQHGTATSPAYRETLPECRDLQQVEGGELSPIGSMEGQVSLIFLQGNLHLLLSRMRFIPPALLERQTENSPH